MKSSGKSVDQGPRAFLQMLLRDNRPGLIGFLLSLLQLAGHGTWIVLVSIAAGSGAASTMDASSALAWVIILVLGISTLLTLTSLFVCLFYGLRKAPRVLPLCGFALSFFTGAFATFAILLSMSR
ncbi:MAG: hypothetical protein ACK526_18180 [Planctomyces sp.]